MKLSPYTIQSIAPIITGDSLGPYRRGSDLVKLFNKFGCRDIYDTLGLPSIGDDNDHRPSRTKYVENRLGNLSGKLDIRGLLNQVLAEADSPEDMAQKMTEFLTEDSFSVVNDAGKFVVEGGAVNNRKAVVNDAHFQNIQSQVLRELDSAKVTINVAMAWFTNEVIRDKLIEKLGQGVDVHIAIFDDGINKKHGVDLNSLPHTLVKGSRGGFMHNKFCVIDNQKVVTGSYNWSNNAETRNDENVTVLNDPDQATNYTLEFRRILK